MTLFLKRDSLKPVFTVFFLILSIGFSGAEEKKTEKDTAKVASYDKFLADKELVGEGLFSVYKKDNDYFFEINDSLLGRDFLLAARVAQLSKTTKVEPGEMRKEPIWIRFSRNNEKLFMHKVVSDELADENDPIKRALDRIQMQPVFETFKIKSLNTDSSAAIIDVTKFLTAEIQGISPFNSKYKAGKLEPDATCIKMAQVFPKNVEVKTQMNYSNTTGNPFVIVMNRSFLLLPEKTMRPRYEDSRIGYFASSALFYTTNEIGVDSKKYIARFDIAPKKEDIEDYKAGKLVVPEKQIVYYYDNAFPEEWWPYIKAGIEDWQVAFEAIGFKDAIVGKPYPVDDPNFNPEDIRHSCIRYIASTKANSMGPRWIDPRSGEVLGGDVLWWHNVTQLLRDWRFVQCGAADPKARKRNPELEMLGEMVRYVIAHEIGHCLGLKHNMRASYAFPVDSLRSATFTQKYGTTPSIMDYARFNYIAQPGDEGIRFTPPNMGPYDIFAIKWGYQPIFEAETADDEKAILNQWILEKKDSLIYRYGDQQMGIAFDPAAQNEALGDNAIKASEYGSKNAQYIMKHLIEWTTEENDDFQYMTHMYEEVLKQYKRYIGHVCAYPGGVYRYQLVEGEEEYFQNPVSKARQQEALAWLFKELANQPSWMLNKEIERRIGSHKNELFKYQASVLDILMGGVVFQKLEMYHNEYSSAEYLNDLHKHIWEKTINGKKLNEFERHLQASYIHNLVKMAGAANGSKEKKESSSLASLTSGTSSKIQFLDNLVKPLVFAEIEKTKNLVNKNLRSKDAALKAHYKYLSLLLADY
ncbi:zinc-dependent metalloprotease [uncultured Draconibacterium sp.]|uniref:zinc-dependent metalloprotease n=1 Tax=uncultured Draconibacterium sp. TaxID=1573823 RepID=UPI0032617450